MRGDESEKERENESGMSKIIFRTEGWEKRSRVEKEETVCRELMMVTLT